MSAMGTVVEGKPAVRPGFFGEHAQELDDVVSRYLPMFYKRAFHFLGNATDAEDAVQDALLSAYKHLGQFRGQAQLSTWLTTIVTNAARMQLRRRRGSYLSLDEQQGEDGLTLSERLPDSKPGQEEVCSAAELHDRLIDGVKQLSPTLRFAASVLHHPIQSIRRCQPALDRRRQNEALDISILTFLLIEARRYEHAGCANRIHCR